MSMFGIRRQVITYKCKFNSFAMCYYFNWSEGQLSVFLCKGSKNYSEILHEVRGSEGSKNDRTIFSEKLITIKMMHNIDPYDSAKTPCLGKNSFFNYGLICRQPIRL